MAERLKAAASKAVVPHGYRGFESLSLRQLFCDRHAGNLVQDPASVEADIPQLPE
jgi:hypothetical protein